MPISQISITKKLLKKSKRTYTKIARGTFLFFAEKYLKKKIVSKSSKYYDLSAIRIKTFENLAQNVHTNYYWCVNKLISFK